MHYIVGTSFTVVQQPVGRSQPSRYDRLFKPGLSYKIVSISKEQDSVNYHFVDATGTHTNVQFATCRDADAVIAKYRNEVIPDYESRMRQDRGD